MSANEPAAKPSEAPERGEDLDRRWARTAPAKVAREAIICGFCDAVVRTYCRRQVTGREHLEKIDGPVIFVANHNSHADTPILLRALPARWRHRTAFAAAADYFYSSFFMANLVSLAFCTIPLDRRGGGAPGEADVAQRMIDDRWSLVIYPEGTRSRDGRVGVLRTGAAMLAAEHGLPIVPVHIGGTHGAMPVGSRWMKRPSGGGPLARHDLRVDFGPPIAVGPESDRFEVMEQVRLFMESCGAETTPDPKLARRARAAGREGARTAEAEGSETG